MRKAVVFRTVADRAALVVGADQRSSSLALRDRLYVEDATYGKLLLELRREGIDQALLLSTCDRIEVQAMHTRPEDAGRRIIGVLARHAGVAHEEIGRQLYVLTGEDALRRIFAVAASLESTVIGEPHVLGQVKDSHRLSRDAGMCGAELDAAMQRAFAAAKRVRTETAVGAGPVSVCAAAVGIAEAVHGDLGAASCVMIGTGEMGELLAEALRAAGLGRLSVTDTHVARAEAAARVLGCHTLALQGLADAGPRADIVIACLGGGAPVVTAEAVLRMLRQRDGRPIVFFDMGLPGDVDPRVDGLDAALLYSLDDLERVARDGRKARHAEVDAARRIVEDEVAGFMRKRAERSAVPVLVRLRGHFEAERLRALGEAGGDAEKATRLLVNRLLHAPIRRLREMAAAGGDDMGDLKRIEDLMGRLFEPDDDETERRQ